MAGGTTSKAKDKINEGFAWPGMGNIRLYVRHEWWPRRYDDKQRFKLSELYVSQLKKILGEISARRAGLAVLREAVRSKKKIFIIPRLLGTTTSKFKSVKNVRNARARPHNWFDAELHGVGSHVTILFLPQVFAFGSGPASVSPDVVLLHELVHALRITGGALTPPDPVLDEVIDWRHVPGMGWKTREVSPEFKKQWGNIEEFSAVLAVNIYRSEKGQKLRASYSAQRKNTPLTDAEQRTFASKYAQIINVLIRDHRTFARELRDVRAPFNPVRDRLAARHGSPS